MTVTAWVAVFATPQLLVMSLVFERDQLAALQSADWIVWTSVLYLGLVMTVVGYDDVAMAAWKTYDLTTLRQPVNRMVDETVSMLLGMIEKTQVPKGRLEIESQLIIRGSARVPEGWTDEGV